MIARNQLTPEALAFIDTVNADRRAASLDVLHRMVWCPPEWSAGETAIIVWPTCISMRAAHGWRTFTGTTRKP